MGALAPPVYSWVPEDDLLLKNAIESGASLESLAKGAVQFSRRFTVRELQDRWHSLLYDPVVSAEASFHVIQLELCALLKLKFGNSKENKGASSKRNSESVRSCYYSMRKRICTEPFDPMDLSFLLAPNDGNCAGNGEEPVHGNCMCEDPMSNHFQLQGPNLDIVHNDFPQILTEGSIDTSGSGAIHAFHTELQNPIEGEFSIQQDNSHEDFPHILGKHMSMTGQEVEDLDRRKDLTMDSLFEVDNLGAQPPTSFEQLTSNQGHPCSEFGGKQICSSPIAVCGESFHNLEYSTPLPELPIWRMVEGLSAPAMPVDVRIGEKDLCTGDTFALPDVRDPMDTTTPRYDVVHADSNLKNEMHDIKLESPNAGTEGYLEELSNSLFSFTNEEELLFMGLDGKDDVIDKSYYDGLSSLLLSSPADAEHDHLPNTTELGTSGTPDAHPTNPVGISPAKFDKDSKSEYGDGLVYCNSETKTLSSAPASNLQLPELCEGFILCTLNTEDTEIPCNDDVFLQDEFPSSAVSSQAQVKFLEKDHRSPSSVKNLLVNQKLIDRGTGQKQRELKGPGQSHVSSQLIGPQVLSGMGLNCASRNDEISADAILPVTLKEEPTGTALASRLGHRSNDSFLDKHYTLPKWELDAPDLIQNVQTLHDSAVSEPVVNPSLSDQDELLVESDGDIPCFSDIEAMILDMDLDPNEQDLHSSAAVSRYQHEEFKRSIIRLEQGAHSYMQRAIASHGAFAILYGRHSKHYIKKPEVLLGRETEDFIVDIDLGREGRANKVSRRQAIIKMDKGGSFCIKNIGKYSISVNDKEAAHGQSLTLNSNCLIEIRGMHFIFETNQTCINQFLEGIPKSNQTIEHQA